MTASLASMDTKTKEGFATLEDKIDKINFNITKKTKYEVKQEVAKMKEILVNDIKTEMKADIGANISDMVRTEVR